jgi:hypothetical protein
MTDGVRLILGVAILVGQMVLVAMVWHLWQMASVHHQRADFEWERIKEKLDRMREELK